MKRFFLFFLLIPFFGAAQISWKNVDSLYQPLPPSLHVYFTDQPLNDAPFRAYYVEADLKDKNLAFTTDTTVNRRLTPLQFYERNHSPLLVVNGTFFSFETNRNLNVVMKDGRPVAFTAPVKGRGKDSLSQWFSFKSAIGISKNRKAEVAWIFTDSSKKVKAFYQPPLPLKTFPFRQENAEMSEKAKSLPYKKPSKWKMETAIGGGPVLVYNSAIFITNNEELMFAGKAINDKHPRTAMGYTADGKLIILVVEGRNPNAAGASLTDLATIMQQIGCVKALNLDGGGSSNLLINGKGTINASDKFQRPVPAVFMIRQKN